MWNHRAPLDRRQRQSLVAVSGAAAVVIAFGLAVQQPIRSLTGSDEPADVSVPPTATIPGPSPARNHELLGLSQSGELSAVDKVDDVDPATAPGGSGATRSSTEPATTSTVDRPTNETSTPTPSSTTGPPETEPPETEPPETTEPPDTTETTFGPTLTRPTVTLPPITAPLPPCDPKAVDPDRWCPHPGPTVIPEPITIP
jgi:hypothetical protein